MNKIGFWKIENEQGMSVIYQLCLINEQERWLEVAQLTDDIEANMLCARHNVSIEDRNLLIEAIQTEDVKNKNWLDDRNRVLGPKREV